jgi:hypothetical protein
MLEYQNIDGHPKHYIMINVKHVISEHAHTVQRMISFRNVFREGGDKSLAWITAANFLIG